MTIKKWQPTNEPVPNKLVFVPKELSKIYEKQNETLRIDQVKHLRAYHARKRDFLKTERGKKFLRYKTEKFKDLQGLSVWFVNGEKLRNGKTSGDVDFVMGGHAYRYLYIPKYEIWIDQIYKNKAEIWSIVWHEYAERNLMLNGENYDSAHTTASHLEILLKDGSYFVLPVGTYRQSYVWTCGPAAMKIVLDFLRWPVTEKYLVKLTKAGPTKGVSPKEIIEAAIKLNFNAYDRRGMTVEEVKNLVKKGNPIIANFQFKHKHGEGHYAVIVGFNEENFILSDPAYETGYRITKISDFIDKWYELEDKTVRQGIVIANKN